MKRNNQRIARVFKEAAQRKPGDNGARDPLAGGIEGSFDFTFRVLDEFPCPVWRSGKDGKCDYFNKAWLDFTGRTLQQELGEGWAKGVHPEDLDRCLHTYFEAFHSRQTFEMEYRLRNAQAEYRWINDCGTPLYDSAGDFAGYIGACFDTTERKLAEEALGEAEQNYREIFEHASEGIFQTTPAGQYIAANPALARMHGFATPEEFIAARRDIGQDVYVDSKVREEFKQLISTHGVVRGFEHQIFRKDGSRIWISVNARAVHDEQGRIRYYEGTAEDISERKRAEDRSRAFAALARKLSGARTRLDACSIIAVTAGDLFGWDCCDLDLYDAARDLVHPMLHVDLINDRPVVAPSLISELKPTTRSRKVIDQGPQLILRDEPDRFADDEVPGRDNPQPAASIMSVPIRNASEVIGLLSIQSYTAHAYDAAALNDIQALADHCGEALKRIEAEESLSESEERFRQMAENIEDILWVANPEFTKVLYINPAYERIFGRLRDTLYENLESFMESVHPDDYQAVRRRLKKKREGDPDPFEFRILQPDGSARWIFVRTFPIRNTHGEVIRMAGVAQDVTESKRAEVELRESEERYRDLVENSLELICTHDLNGLILSANRAAAEALGVDLDQLVGKQNIRDLLAPAYREQFDEYVERVKTRLATSGLMVVQTSSGDERVWEYYNSIRTEGVSEPIVRGIARDITEPRRAARALRESEARYRELFENSRDAIYVHDLNGRYVSVNRAAEELSGFKREEILGKHYSNFISPRHLKGARENFYLKLDAEVETTYEAEVICKNGTRKPVEVNSRMIFKDGVAVGVQGTARDISERKHAEDVLQTYSRRLTEAQEAERQRIARELHDEVGQVLTAIRLNLQSIQTVSQSEEQLSRIRESIAVVDQAFTQVRELSLDLRPALLDDLGLAAALRWYAARYTQRSGIAAEVTGEPKIGPIPQDVKTACFRITQEALTNTARHAAATKASVHIEKQNGQLFLTISDDGIGFDIDNYFGGVPASSVMGLRGMHERAVAVRGHFQISSTPGRGTRIVVKVPLSNEKATGR